MPHPLSAPAKVAAGDVMLLRAQNNSSRLFHDGDLLKLQKGDQVITDSGMVTVTHFPAQVAVIEPGAHLELAELDEADGGVRVAMDVHDGAVRGSLDAPLDAKNRFVVRAPNVEVTAHGTEFAVEDQDATGQWYRVCGVAGRKGWLHLPRLEPAR